VKWDKGGRVCSFSWLFTIHNNFIHFGWVKLTSLLLDLVSYRSHNHWYAITNYQFRTLQNRRREPVKRVVEKKPFHRRRDAHDPKTNFGDNSEDNSDYGKVIYANFIFIICVFFSADDKVMESSPWTRKSQLAYEDIRTQLDLMERKVKITQKPLLSCQWHLGMSQTPSSHWCFLQAPPDM